jgi:hypothetical protein
LQDWAQSRLLLQKPPFQAMAASEPKATPFKEKPSTD